MALRLDEYVSRGEIRNSDRNRVSGWLEILRSEFDGTKEVVQSSLILLSLTGNLSGELEGTTFRFVVREVDLPKPRPVIDKTFQNQQIGVMGDSVFRMVRIPSVPVDEFLEARKRGESPSEEQRASIYMEWFSQNGRVVLELLDPKIEFEGQYQDLADPEPEDVSSSESFSSPEITTIIRNPDGTFDILDEEGRRSKAENPLRAFDPAESVTEPDESDPFALFPDNLEQQIHESATDASALDAMFDAEDAADLKEETVPDGEEIELWQESEKPDDNDHENDSDHSSAKFRDWSEVIPGIDPATKAMYEEWDEVIYGTKDEPLTWLFDDPLCLPKPKDLQDETHAWQVLSTLLAAMALRGVAFDMCPHFTATEAYRLLIEELLPKAGVHPNLAATGFVKHYSSWEYCEQCEAEFDERHND